MTLLINIVVALVTEAKIILAAWWESDRKDKVEAIKQSPPTQAILRVYDWLLSQA